MDGSKKSTNLEKKKIRYLLSRDNIKTNVRYLAGWHSMLHSAAEDAHTHCDQIANMLSKSKVRGLEELDVPPAPTKGKCKLSIPALAFVVTKLLKTFDMKLEEEKHRSLNASHSPDWIRHINDIHDHVLDSEEDKESYLFVSSTRHYDPLTHDEIEYLNKLTEINAGGVDGIVGDSDYDGDSDYIDASSEGEENG